MVDLAVQHYLVVHVIHVGLGAFREAAVLLGLEDLHEARKYVDQGGFHAALDPAGQETPPDVRELADQKKGHDVGGFADPGTPLEGEPGAVWLVP